MITLSQDVLRALSAAETRGPALVLVGQLDRKLYADVNKVLDAAGGKWSRKDKAHIFDGDAAEAIEPILLTGTVQRVKQEFGQFDSPPEVVRRVIELARIEPGMAVLEPSCGVGNLVGGAKAAGGHVTAWEIDRKRADKMMAFFPAVPCVVGDFLKEKPLPLAHRVVMNPPFARQADIGHVLHATRFLKPGGRLVAVMSAGIQFRTDLKTQNFLDVLTFDVANHAIEALPEGAFKAAGTMVRACIVSFDLRGDEHAAR